MLSPEHSTRVTTLKQPCISVTAKQYIQYEILGTMCLLYTFRILRFTFNIIQTNSSFAIIIYVCLFFREVCVIAKYRWGALRGRYCLILTNSKALNQSWEYRNYVATQEISCILWNQKFHYCTYKNLPLTPILNQINPVHTFLSYFFKIYFHIIILFRSSSGSDFHTGTLYALLSCDLPISPTSIDHSNNI
jgi:hypothetical protein